MWQHLLQIKRQKTKPARLKSLMTMRPMQESKVTLQSSEQMPNAVLRFVSGYGCIVCVLCFEDFNPEVTWVVKRYTPLDERTYAPVPRHKYILRPSSVPPPAHWIPPRADSGSELIKFTRQRQEKSAFQ